MEEEKEEKKEAKGFYYHGILNTSEKSEGERLEQDRSVEEGKGPRSPPLAVIESQNQSVNEELFRNSGVNAFDDNKNCTQMDEELPSRVPLLGPAPLTQITEISSQQPLNNSEMKKPSKIEKIAEILPSGQEEDRATALRMEENDSQIYVSSKP